MNKQVFCVLGMHRSGTSCLTGSLQNAGVYLGNHSTWNPHNLRGNRENADIVEFHDRLLADNIGSWDQPPTLVKWRAEHYETARGFISSFNNSAAPCWGFKDPRTLLALDGWLELLPDLQMIGIFRHPAAVVRSIRKRGGGFSQEDILRIWNHYNKRLLVYRHKYDFPLLSFDWEEAILQQKLNDALRVLGLATEPSHAPFFTNDLRSNLHDSAAELPEDVALTYQQLIDLTL
ncbi:MAG: sulfotransferase [Pseudomonadales bacterium]